MRYVFFILFFTKLLFGVNLLTYKIYDRENRIDLMLTFDEPYNGKIKKRKIEGYTIIKLYNLKYNDEIKESVDSKVAKEVDIIPRKNSLYVLFKSQKDINLQVDKTIDNFGLRVRALLKTPPKELEPMPVVSPIKKEDKESDDLKIGQNSSISIGYGYYIALFSLIVIAVILYFLRNALKDKKSVGGWLFKKVKNNEIEIKFQRPLDARNRVVLIEYKNSSYLLLIGNSNLLLDKFPLKSIKKEDEFEDIFEKNRQRLDEYLKLNDEKFQNYKEKVSKDIEKLLK